MLPHKKCEGSGAPKGAGNNSTPCGARPCEGRSPRGAPLRRVSLDLETAFSRRTGAPIRYALDSAGFHPRSSARTSRLNRRTHVLGPGSVSRGPRRRVCETHPQAPSPFHHLDASRWHPHVNEPRTKWQREESRSTGCQQKSVKSREVRPCSRDCFVALRAPRNDGAIVGA